MPQTLQTKDDVPASAGWWEVFSQMAAARPKAIEDRLFDCYIKDRNLFPTDPDRTTIIRKLAKQGAQALMRPLIILTVLLVPALVGWTTPAMAYFPANESGVMVSTCHDRDELAGILMVEGGAQPTRDIIRMGQIIKAEADSRGLTICALSHLTNFISVRHYIESHPDSYAAHRFASPPEWALDLASGVLLGQFEDVRDGAMHFDGSPDGMRILFRP